MTPRTEDLSVTVRRILDPVARDIDGWALALGIGAAYVTYKLARLRQWRNTPPPGATMADPVPHEIGKWVGWMPVFETEPGEHITNQLAKYPEAKALYITMINGGIVVPATLEDALYISSNNTTYIKGPEYPASLGPIFGYNGLLLVTDDDYHTTVRRKLGPAFSASAASEMADSLMAKHVSHVLADLVPSSTTETTVNMQSVAASFALGVIQDAAFRPELAEKKLGNGKSLGEVTGSTVRNIPLVWYQFLPGGSKIPTARRREVWNNQRYIADALHELVHRLLQNPAPLSEWVLIDRVINADLTDEEIFDNAMTFLFGGYETTATTLGWLCYELAVNPDVQDKLFEELEQVVPADGVASIQALKNCDYLEAVMQESMRLHPPIWCLPRQTTTTDVLPSGVQLPQGASVWVFFAPFHRSKAIWGDDANDFRPDRWFNATKQQRDAYMPFWTGKRGCIGKEFAMNELRMLVATLARRYTMRWPTGTRAPRGANHMTMAPDIPIDVIMQRRQ